MDRQSKILRLKSLEELIKKQELVVSERKLAVENAKKDLDKLNQKYQKENVSELPILLFLINKTLPMPDDIDDWEFEYIYYCPDLDKVIYSSRHRSNEMLPNTIDLRSLFINFGMPERIWPRRADAKIIDEAVQVLKEQIEEIFSNYEINSWEELGRHLGALKENKKTLKVK